MPEPDYASLLAPPEERPSPGVYHLKPESLEWLRHSFAAQAFGAPPLPPSREVEMVKGVWLQELDLRQHPAQQGFVAGFIAGMNYGRRTP